MLNKTVLQIWVVQQFPDTQYFHLFSVLPLFLCDMCQETQVKVHNDQRNASLWCHCTNLHSLVLLRLMNLSSSGDERVTFKYLIKLQCYLGYSLYKHVKQDSLQNVALHAMTVVTVNRTKDGDCLVSKNVDIAQNATNMDYKLMYLTNLGPYDFCHVENTDSHRIQT